jgi:MFS family permease
MSVTAGAMLVSPTLPVVIGAMAFSGLLNGPMDVALFTLRQRRTDPAWMGRAFAVSMSLNFVGYPIGAAIGGVLVATSTGAALGVAVFFTLLAGILAALLLPRSSPAKPATAPVAEPAPPPTPADPTPG